MKNRLHTFATAIAAMALLYGCSEDNSSFEAPNTSGTATNTGIVSQKNFSVLTADVAPAVIDTTGLFTKTDVEITAYIGDRNNQTLTDAHTIYFAAEYGLIAPSCVTTEGSCTVTWSAIKRPVTNGPGDDGIVTIVAYTLGEEGFDDLNGNGMYDDADDGATPGFDDIEEPFVDVNESNAYDTGDTIIDVVSASDPTGANLTHDNADGFFNGPGCSHTSLCSSITSITVFSSVEMTIKPFSVGGTVTGLTGTVVLQNNTSDDLTLSTNGNFTFTTELTSGSTYAVTVKTDPAGQTCTVTNGNGTINRSNVTDIAITCM